MAADGRTESSSESKSTIPALSLGVTGIILQCLRDPFGNVGARRIGLRKVPGKLLAG